MQADTFTALKSIRRQFLCKTPLKTFNWHGLLGDLTVSKQEALLENTVNHSKVIAYPLKISYQKAFLKILLDQLVKQNAATADGVYEAYGRLVALDESSCYYKHFEVNEGEFVTLIEKSAFISEGTTGLSTWEASLFLSEWCIDNKSRFKNKTVLELGAGVGLVGITVKLKCQPSRVFLTDCHEAVLATLTKNVALNFGDTSNISVLNLPWQEVTREKCAFLGKIDVIIASDVVYDSQLFHPLADAIKSFLVGGAEIAYLACTERDRKTLSAFLEVLKEKSLGVSVLEAPKQKHFVWPSDAKIFLFGVTYVLEN